MWGGEVGRWIMSNYPVFNPGHVILPVNTLLRKSNMFPVYYVHNVLRVV